MTMTPPHSTASTPTPSDSPTQGWIHPGSGRRKPPVTPKGRQVDPQAIREVQAALEEAGSGPPDQRDLLIEHLHALQDFYGILIPRHLAALADLARLSLAEVYETATFYAHFQISRSDDLAPPRATIRVCDGVVCMIQGAEALLRETRANAPADVRVVPAPCMGWCDRAPAAMVGQRHISAATPERLVAAAVEGSTDPIPITFLSLDETRIHGGYLTLQHCLDGRLDREEVVNRVETAGLRGMGGAGFKSGLKWRLVRKQPAPRLMAINADEGEPGTFKDRHHLELDPHRFLEGMLIAAWAVEAEACYIYLRDEYPHLRKVLLREIERVARAGLSPHCRIVLRRGAGAYICGEESAMLESLEGKRGYPRHKPPYPVEVGLFGRPTLIHNVETVYWLRDILERGPDWFARHGRRGRTGLRSFSVSGRVAEPGVKLAPAGITARELIDEYCGGMSPGHTLKAYLPGGASGGLLPARLADEPLDFGTLDPYGCFIGSAAVVVFSEQDSLRAVVRNLLKFFEHESCGQCTPCRVGTEKLVQLTDPPGWDRPLLLELSETMRQASICGLGQAAPNPLLSLLRFFPDE